jgi:hypothetical protein
MYDLMTEKTSRQIMQLCLNEKLILRANSEQRRSTC